MDASTHQLLVLLGTLFASGALVVPVATILKKVFGLQTKSVVHTVVVAISFVMAAGQYVLQLKAQLPPEFLGLSTSVIYGWSKLVYKYGTYGVGFLNRVDVTIAPSTTTTNSTTSIPVAGKPTFDL